MARQEKLGSIGEDFDGVHTLGSEAAYLSVFQGVMTELHIFDVQQVEERMHEFWGSAMEHVLENILRDRTDLWVKGKQILKELLMDVFPDQIRPVPGATESTERLSKKFNLALITAADRDVLLQKLFPKLGLRTEFFNGGIFTADQLDPRKNQYPKPHPHVLNEFMKRTGTVPQNTIMVGDSETDVLSAYAAGVEPVVTLTGNLSRKEAEDLEVSHIIEDITKLETDIIPRTIGRTGVGKFGWGLPADEKAWRSAHEISIV
ncbi:MAG TPA: HAD hydrolase-like protein [Candidatus Saccharimonadales bacterium]|nr:HAD hydrolase-like protein [Candidatus Saccharimonadales bacterium]